MKSHLRIRALCEGAIFVALATVLSLFKLFSLPQGGSVNLAMVPLLLYCVRWGAKDGVLAGLVYGILQLFIDGAYAWGWQSIILDYILAFPLLGLAGLFHGKTWGVFVGPVVGCVCRFAAHFISGITVFRILTPTELLGRTFVNPYLYSAVYNGSFILVDLAICLVIFAIVFVPLKKYFLGKDLQNV